MPLGSANKSIIKSLVETIKYNIEPPKLYDALRKITDDLNKVYESLFEGPLPGVSGKNLNLSEVPKTSLPSFIAFIDQENTFQFSQFLRGEGLALTIQYFVTTTNTLGDKHLRVQQPVDGHALFSSNLSFDGVDYAVDSGDGSGLELVDDVIKLRQRISDIDYVPLEVNHDRVIKIGIPSTVVDADIADAVADEIVIGHDKFIYGLNAAEDDLIPIVKVTVDDLVELGSNPVGSTTGEGNIGIPRALVADLPTAGATRDGIIIIDKTNKRLCYYVGGLRYFIPIGTLF